MLHRTFPPQIKIYNVSHSMPRLRAVFSLEIVVLFLRGILMTQTVNVIVLKVVIKHSEENLE